MANKTITLNGKLYDAVTGLPVPKPTPKPVKPKVPSPRKVLVKAPRKIRVIGSKAPKPAPAKPVKPAKKPVHKPAPSKTLNRQAVKKPAPIVKRPPLRPVAPAPRVARPGNFQTVPRVAIRPTPIVQRGIRRTPPPRPISRQTIFNSPQPAPQPVPKTAEQKKRSRLISLVVSGGLVLMVVAAILLYFLVPSISLWVAASRADVRASLPTYVPAGYAVSGTVESSPGLVNINYKASADSPSYSISMANSNWDSEGVLENKVKPISTNYQTLTQKGLTIYRYKDHACWVNGGVLYTITDSSTFTNEQILKIVDGI